jgi:anti-sigma B factor antagonist
MTISKKADGDKLIIFLDGRLDTLTAPDLEKEVQKSLNGVGELIFDFEKLEYISSAGLRVLLAIERMMSDQGTMKVINANEIVREVFEVTGFSDIITVE